MKPYEINDIIIKINTTKLRLIAEAEKKGKNHGRRTDTSIPLTEIEGLRSDFENINALIRKESHLEEYRQNFLEAQELLNEYDKKSQNSPNYISENEVRIDKECDKLLKERETKHSSEIDRIGGALEDNETKLEKSENVFLKAESEKNKYHLDNKIDPRWSLVIIFFLTFLEIPFTYSAFLVLKTTPAVSISIAILLSAALAFSSHLVGLSTKAKNNNWMSIILTLVSLAAIQVASHFRTLHANNLKIDGAVWFSTDDIFFLVIGITIYLICVAISFFAHNSNEASKQVHKQFKLTKRKYEKDKVFLESEIARLQEERTIAVKELVKDKQIIRTVNEQKKENIRNYRISLVSKRRKSIGFYEEALDYYKNLEVKIENDFRRVLTSYRIAYVKEFIMNGTVNKTSDELNKELEAFFENNLKLEKYFENIKSLNPLSL